MKYLVLIALLPIYSAWGQMKLSKAQIQKIEAILLREMHVQKIPGLQIAISVDTSVIWQSAYGLADIENSIPVSVNTRFRSASIGKPMTAALALQLRDAGDLQLNDEIQKYIPDFPVKKWPILVRHLLTQQSGIRGYFPNEI